ncbi:hypothetical protein RX481_002336 [Morganella morganii]|uniref:DUF7279 family protein n=1 Tax=Morganella morganii TaxID=582 RepID=UPI0021A5CBDE|nr:hypothetical protein [Morganella morganii]EKV4236597.1 hypothetical protein [Morganella morganii]ELL8928803.1 hypothetical protein [Morganella morganii]MCT1587272.1 hypothetical protein [Morganella morganii]
MIEKPIYYMSAERPSVEENHFLLCITSVTDGGAEALSWKKFSVKPTKRQVRKLTKFVLNHIKQIQEG